MTLKDYISEKLRAYGVGDTHFADLAAAGYDVDAELGSYSPEQTGAALICTLEECILAPRLNSASEGGFSVSYNYENVSRYYLWLCHKWKVEPKRELTAMLGLNTITDISDRW